MQIIDISPLLSERTAVYPGDVPLRRRIALDFARGDDLLLSSLEVSLHIGAHADAPNHILATGGDMASQDLAPYLGLCQVIRADPGEGPVTRAVLADRPLNAERVLFRTDSNPDPNGWSETYRWLDPGLIHELADRGTRLVGIDTPSVDAHGDDVLAAHHALFERELAVLEGLVLSHVEPGLYVLIALPLRLSGADASPVRAVLLPYPPQFH